MKPDVGILAFILMRIEWAELPNTRRFAWQPIWNLATKPGRFPSSYDHKNEYY
jgi:hypothetical protein